MVFSSVIFLFFFLPLVLLAYFVAPRWLKNAALLIFSLFFYAWGESAYVLLMLASIAANYGFGLALSRWRERPRGGLVLALAVAFNLSTIGYFKYAAFLSDNLNALLDTSLLAVDDVHLPIGISFFTFQALSYIVDVYRGTSPVQHNPLNLGLYISLFPQLIAGPIVRYHDIAAQIEERRITLDGFAQGARRFSFGLGKKVLIANNVAILADEVFAMDAAGIGSGLAWLGVLCYTLQIFFDFSGYSDMAIGLGQMFGFRLPENFNFPYISGSVREFWRRWHITLSTWFRDYLYIPLGGNRKGTLRTYLNLYVVFFLTGLWHGASWTFIVWGLIHGTAMVIERVGWGEVLQRLPGVVRLVYAQLVVVLSWVFFRAESFDHAFAYLTTMFSFRPEAPPNDLYQYLNGELVAALVAGLLFAFPIVPALGRWLEDRLQQTSPRLGSLYQDALLPAAGTVAMLAVLLLSILNITAQAYNPFIYYRF